MLNSQYQFEAGYQKTESLRYWNNNASKEGGKGRNLKGDLLELTQEALETQASTKEEETVYEIPEKDKQKILLLESLLRH
jgi:hypothetical protein